MDTYSKRFLVLASLVGIGWNPVVFASDDSVVKTIWLKCQGKLLSDTLWDTITDTLGDEADPNDMAEFKALASNDLEPHMLKIQAIEGVVDGTGYCNASIEHEWAIWEKVPLQCEVNGLTYFARVGCNEREQCLYRIDIDRRSLSFSMGVGMELNGSTEYLSATGQCEISDSVI